MKDLKKHNMAIHGEGKPYPGYTTEEDHRKKYPKGSPQGLTAKEKELGYEFYKHGHRVAIPSNAPDSVKSRALDELRKDKHK